MNKLNNRESLRRNCFLDEDTHGGGSKYWGNPKTPVKKKKRIPVMVTIVIDLLIAAVALYVFSLNYFLLPQDLSKNAQPLPHTAAPSEAKGAAVIKADENMAPDKEQTQVAVRENSMWGAKFPGKFTNGAIEKTDSSYKSENIDVSVNRVQKDGITYFVADIYLKDIKHFKTAFAKGKYGKGFHDHTDVIAAENDAILAINGDYCGNNAGPVVRNGVLYREEKYKDVLVMNDDGSMQTLTAKEFDIGKIKSQGAYQIWTFGPMLLKDGQPLTKFNSDLSSANPRTAIGYYEPGHYCFVVVDGRQPGYSSGITLKALSRLFYDLGCSVAYNLDGGQTSEMVFQNKFVNQPYKGGRSVSDIVYIVEE